MNLRPGIALSAEQIAQLTADIVWLVEKEITLPGVNGQPGAVQKALVPQLYAVPHTGDLRPDGALLSGADVQISADGTLNNSGTLLGRRLVQINAGTVNNLLGDIQAQSTSLTATGDINNLGGTISAEQSLSLAAGRDINVATQTSASTNGSRLSERVAGLYVTGSGATAGGTLTVNAGRDLNLTAAQIQNSGQGAGDTTLSAQRNVNLNALTTGETLHFESHGEAEFRQHLEQSQQTGSNIQSAGNLNISAGQNITGTAAQINAQGDVALNAGGNIALLAGQATQSSDLGWTATDKGLFSSSSTTTRIQSSSASAIASSVQGNNVSITAGRNLTSVGTQFQAQTSLTVEGKETQAFYEARNTEQSQTSVRSSSSLLGISLEDKTTTDSAASSTALATRLSSTERIDVRVGERATLQGAELQAKDIAFTQADPSKAGELVLGSSVSTTQTAHTEKTETLGVWQEMKGNGSTTQTAKLTTLKGNVSLDPNLKLTVQTASTPDINRQLQSLSSQPGLAYLKDLAANPNVKWEQIRLANEQWSYSQQGLTPAGAALLSIAVAAATGGMGASLAGTTSAMTGAAINAGFSALASQAAVAMVNNGGDIGKTLEQLGSEQGIKNLLTAMATAGALEAINPGSAPTATGQTGTAAQPVATSQLANDFLGNLQRNVTNNIASRVIDAAINGKPLDEKTLTNALTSAFIAAGMAQGANAIGDAKDKETLNTYTQAAAHALLGCVAGAATTSGGCAAGAVGGVVGELSAAYAKDAGLSDQNAVALAKTLSALAGVLAGGGGGNVAAVNVAAQTGANAAQYNTLYHYQGKIIARDSKNNDKLVDLSAKDMQTIAAAEKDLLMREVAGLQTNSINLTKISDTWATRVSGSTLYDLNNAQDRATLQTKADMGYTNIDDKSTRVYVQTGMNTATQGAAANAQNIANIIGAPVGVILNGTEGLPRDVEEFLPKNATIKDALNEYTYRALNDKGPTLIVTHSAGNNDASKAMQLGSQLGNQYPNLSLLSLGSPISNSIMRSASTQTGVNYLGQINDWRDPVTNPTLWVTGSAALLAGGAAAGVALAPATGGGSLYAYFTSLIGGGIGGGIGVYGINNYHPLANYITKPATQSIMFDWLKNNPR